MSWREAAAAGAAVMAAGCGPSALAGDELLCSEAETAVADVGDLAAMVDGESDSAVPVVFERLGQQLMAEVDRTDDLDTSSEVLEAYMVVTFAGVLGDASSVGAGLDELGQACDDAGVSVDLDVSVALR